MKVHCLIASLTLALAGTASAAGDHDHAHEHKPLHGGVVVEVKDIDHERVATPAAIQLHLRDHGKAADIGKSSAKLTLPTGTDKQPVMLKPAGDRPDATGRFNLGPGTKVVATVSTPGRNVANVRFTLK